MSNIGNKSGRIKVFLGTDENITRGSLLKRTGIKPSPECLSALRNGVDALWCGERVSFKAYT